jgi:D-3-phosphoglycerate dehydrogenase
LNSRNKIKVFAADKIHDDGLELLSKNFEVSTMFGLGNDELIDIISRSKTKSTFGDILIIRSTRKLDSTCIKKLKSYTSVRAICTVSSGFDNIDVVSAKRNKIKVFNVPNGNYISAAEHTFAMLLAITKKLREKHAEIKSKKFYTQAGQTIEVYGRTIGIVGVGRVGSYVAKLAKTFGMKVLGNDIKKSLRNKYKWIKFVSLNTLLGRSDYITLHTPLDETTKHLINKENIKLIRETAVVLNCARGGVIDEKALFNALKSKRIAYSGIDVFENEPKINFNLAELSNVLLTPHIAGKTVESYRRMAVQAAKILINYF